MYILPFVFNREAARFFHEGLLSNVDGLVSYLSRLTMKCSRLSHQIDNVCGAMRSCFAHVQYMFSTFARSLR